MEKSKSISLILLFLIIIILVVGIFSSIMIYNQNILQNKMSNNYYNFVEDSNKDRLIDAQNEQINYLIKSNNYGK